MTSALSRPAIVFPTLFLFLLLPVPTNMPARQVRSDTQTESAGCTMGCEKELFRTDCTQPDYVYRVVGVEGE